MRRVRDVVRGGRAGIPSIDLAAHRRGRAGAPAVGGFLVRVVVAGVVVAAALSACGVVELSTAPPAAEPERLPECSELFLWVQDEFGPDVPIVSGGDVSPEGGGRRVCRFRSPEGPWGEDWLLYACSDGVRLQMFSGVGGGGYRACLSMLEVEAAFDG